MFPRHLTRVCKRTFFTSSPAFSGHNKWSKIKHKKGAMDAQKSTIYGRATRVRQPLPSPLPLSIFFSFSPQVERKCDTNRTPWSPSRALPRLPRLASQPPLDLTRSWLLRASVVVVVFWLADGGSADPDKNMALHNMLKKSARGRRAQSEHRDPAGKVSCVAQGQRREEQGRAARDVRRDGPRRVWTTLDD
ncbi:hypothetical protein EW146_g1233 [Bondarzewia mesenterica]|uniref:Uncharacterized protein n=1 Tax=Bondarzewia mesenterica TaxID=1095465 RepID=A0A4S4M4I7_9AGAM|nr:hypothetical protein EW146_g1233 [Bondarzewia mesenterica]